MGRCQICQDEPRWGVAYYSPYGYFCSAWCESLWKKQNPDLVDD